MESSPAPETKKEHSASKDPSEEDESVQSASEDEGKDKSDSGEEVEEAEEDDSEDEDTSIPIEQRYLAAKQLVKETNAKMKSLVGQIRKCSCRIILLFLCVLNHSFRNETNILLVGEYKASIEADKEKLVEENTALKIELQAAKYGGFGGLPCVFRSFISSPVSLGLRWTSLWTSTKER